MTVYTITVDDNYVVPEVPLTKEQYIDFVVNIACASYATQYGTVDKDSGIQAACDAYNSSLPPQE